MGFLIGLIFLFIFGGFFVAIILGAIGIVGLMLGGALYLVFLALKLIIPFIILIAIIAFVIKALK